MKNLEYFKVHKENWQQKTPKFLQTKFNSTLKRTAILKNFKNLRLTNLTQKIITESFQKIIKSKNLQMNNRKKKLKNNNNL